MVSFYKTAQRLPLYIGGQHHMKYPWIEEYLLEKKGVRKDYKAEWNWDRYLIGDKMFAAVCYGDNHQPVYVTLKLDPMEGDFLRRQYEDIIPGYYMNKVHWNSVKADGAVPEDVVKILLDHSYDLLLSTFSKKKRMEILGDQI